MGDPSWFISRKILWKLMITKGSPMTLETSICECWDIPETPSYIPARLFGHFRAVMQGQSWNGFCIETWLVCFVCLSSLQRQVCSIGDLINQSSSCSRSSSFPLCNESWPVKYVIFLPTFQARAPLGRLAANVVRHSPSTCGFWIAQPKMAFDRMLHERSQEMHFSVLPVWN